MQPILHFILANGIQLSLFFFGFLLGASLLGTWVYCRGRKKLENALEEAKQTQLQLNLSREELAGLTGRHSQMEHQLSEQARLLKEARLQLGQEFENLANRIFEAKQQQFDAQNQKTLNQSLTPLKSQIEEFKKQVTDVYQKESAERNQLIGKIGELQLQTQKIGEDAINLALALKGDNKTQGNWGEVVLERLLEESGLQKGREYDTQVSMNDDSGKRRNPDVIIYLPENKQLIIDAKVSLADYERYSHANTEEEKKTSIASPCQFCASAY